MALQKQPATCTTCAKPLRSDNRNMFAIDKDGMLESMLEYKQNGAQ